MCVCVRSDGLFEVSPRDKEKRPKKERKAERENETDCRTKEKEL